MSKAMKAEGVAAEIPCEDELAQPVGPVPHIEATGPWCEPRAPGRPSSRPVGSQVATLRPVLGWLRRYDRHRLRPDLLAGCVVAALGVPQALSYVAIARCTEPECAWAMWAWGNVGLGPGQEMQAHPMNTAHNQLSLLRPAVGLSATS